MKTALQTLQSALREVICVGMFMLMVSPGFGQYKGLGYKTKGFTYIAELGCYIPSNVYGLGFSVRNSAGYLFNHIYAGANVGMDVFGSDIMAVGLADVRIFPLGDEYSPIIQGEAGYAYGFEDAASGLTYGGSAGMRYMLERSVSIFGLLGYKVQTIPENFTGTDPGFGQTAKQFGMFTFRMGLQF